MKLKYLILALVGLAWLGFIVYQKNQVPSQRSDQDYEIFDCKTYTLRAEKLTFTCPSNWKLKIDKSAYDPSIDQPARDNVEILSPNNFRIRINTGAQFGGGCDEGNCPQQVNNTVLAKLNYYKNSLYVVVHGVPNETISFSVIERTSCVDHVCGGYKGKNVPLGVKIRGGYIENYGHYKYVDPEIFINSKDVKEAIEILKTLHY